jgi:hypothetical protein
MLCQAATGFWNRMKVITQQEIEDDFHCKDSLLKHERKKYLKVTQILSASSNLRLIDYCFTSRSRIFHLHRDVTTTGEGLQN